MEGLELEGCAFRAGPCPGLCQVAYGAVWEVAGAGLWAPHCQSVEERIVFLNDNNDLDSVEDGS